MDTMTKEQPVKELTHIEALRALVSAALKLREEQAKLAIADKIAESYKIGNQAARACYEAIIILDEKKDQSNRHLCEALIEFAECSAYDAHWLVSRVRGR